MNAGRNGRLGSLACAYLLSEAAKGLLLLLLPGVVSEWFPALDQSPNLVFCRLLGCAVLASTFVPLAVYQADDLVTMGVLVSVRFACMPLVAAFLAEQSVPVHCLVPLFAGDVVFGALLAGLFVKGHMDAPGPLKTHGAGVLRLVLFFVGAWEAGFAVNMFLDPEFYTHGVPIVKPASAMWPMHLGYRALALELCYGGATGLFMAMYGGSSVAAASCGLRLLGLVWVVDVYSTFADEDFSEAVRLPKFYPFAGFVLLVVACVQMASEIRVASTSLRASKSKVE